MNIKAKDLLQSARNLQSFGQNPEYDRALIELIADLLGIPSSVGHEALRLMILDSEPLADWERELLDGTL